MTPMSAAEYRAQAAKPKRKNKYNAKRVTVGDRTYDSHAEMVYGEQLLLLEKSGLVGGIERQRAFKILGPKGELITTYRADFAFWDHAEGRFRVVDVKGVETPVFKIKRNLMRAYLGIEVEVVKS